MKKKFFYLMVACIAIGSGLSLSSFVDDDESGDDGGGVAHCYDITTYSCGDVGFGTSCSFTHTYGDPTTCTIVACNDPFGILTEPHRCIVVH